MKTFRFLIAALLLLFGLPSLALSASQVPENSPAPQGYMPVLGEIMSAIQMRHAKLWYAGKGKNWPLAAYELDEIKEAFGDAAKYQPNFKGKPIAEMVGPVTAASIEQLEKAVAAKDSVRFVKAYDELSRACTSCHQATEHGFIVIQRPSFPPLTNQRYDIGT